MVVNCIMLNRFDNYNLTPIVIKCMFNVIKYNKTMMHSYNKPTKYVALNNETLKYLQNIDGPNCQKVVQDGVEYEKLCIYHYDNWHHH